MSRSFFPVFMLGLTVQLQGMHGNSWLLRINKGDSPVEG